jgi:hypothetical protein
MVVADLPYLCWYRAGADVNAMTPVSRQTHPGSPLPAARCTSPRLVHQALIRAAVIGQ